MNLLAHPRAPMIFLAHVCAVVIVMIFGIALGLAAPYFPAAEGLLSPIVASSVVPDSIYRDDDKACFTLDLRKLRRAIPVLYQFSIEVRQSERWLDPISVNAHVATDDNEPAADHDFREHPVGSTWQRRWCFALPASVSSWQVIRVSGYAVHRAHPLYDTHTAIPAIVIPGV